MSLKNILEKYSMPFNEFNNRYHVLKRLLSDHNILLDLTEFLKYNILLKVILISSKVIEHDSMYFDNSKYNETTHLRLFNNYQLKENSNIQ